MFTFSCSHSERSTPLTSGDSFLAFRLVCFWCCENPRLQCLIAHSCYENQADVHLTQDFPPQYIDALTPKSWLSFQLILSSYNSYAHSNVAIILPFDFYLNNNCHIINLSRDCGSDHGSSSSRNTPSAFAQSVFRFRIVCEGRNLHQMNHPSPYVHFNYKIKNINYFEAYLVSNRLGYDIDLFIIL